VWRGAMVWRHLDGRGLGRLQLLCGCGPCSGLAGMQVEGHMSTRQHLGACPRPYLGDTGWLAFHSSRVFSMTATHGLQSLVGGATGGRTPQQHPQQSTTRLQHTRRGEAQQQLWIGRSLLLLCGLLAGGGGDCTADTTFVLYPAAADGTPPAPRATFWPRAGLVGRSQ
jgi:hypothetical protein